MCIARHFVLVYHVSYLTFCVQPVIGTVEVRDSLSIEAITNATYKRRFLFQSATSTILGMHIICIVFVFYSCDFSPGMHPI